jgi:hypothetical protein
MSTYFLKGTWNGASFRVEKEFYRIIFARGIIKVIYSWKGRQPFGIFSQQHRSLHSP